MKIERSLSVFDVSETLVCLFLLWHSQLICTDPPLPREEADQLIRSLGLCCQPRGKAVVVQNRGRGGGSSLNQRT